MPHSQKHTLNMANQVYFMSLCSAELVIVKWGSMLVKLSINQSKTIIPHKLQSSTTYSRHQGSNMERGKLKCNTYKTLSPVRKHNDNKCAQ